MEPADQCRAVAVGVLDRLEQRPGQEPVRHDETADDPQTGRLRSLEERGRCRCEVRSEHERGRRAVRRKRADEATRGVGGVADVCHPRLFRQRHVFEPVEERPPQTADDSQLRGVHVRIHKSRQDQAASPIDEKALRRRHVKEFTGLDRPILMPGTGITTIAQRLTTQDVDALPVIGEHGTVVGVVTRAALVQAVADHGPVGPSMNGFPLAE